ncbi:NAD-dependent epimerase/dehydratase family protein [Chloroflexota bacterium]
MKILITGSSGTIGTRLFERLLPEHEVTGVDIRPNQWLPSLNERTKRVDLRERSTLAALSEDVDLVVHFAANARVYELVKEPDLALDNIIMTYNVLEYLRKNNIRRAIFASSRETYGNIMESSRVAEDAVRLENCESPYSASKVSGEALFHSYAKVYGINSVILRFSNVYGMYDDSDRVIPLWIRQFMNNEDVVIFGQEKVLDFTYIDDTVGAVTRVIERFEEVTGATLNIASGKGIKLRDIAEELKKAFDSRSKFILKDNRPGEVWKFEADVSRAMSLLGYHPEVDIAEGLKKTTDWYRQYYK